MTRQRIHWPVIYFLRYSL